MEISAQQVDGVWVVTARGRLDGATSEAFAQQIDALIGPEQRLLVDFSGVDFISSAGLRSVLILIKKIKAAKGVLALCGVQAPVQEVLDITGFAGMIDIHPGRAQALAALS